VLLAFAGLATGPTAAQQPSPREAGQVEAEPSGAVWRLYDLRDLLGVLPPNPCATQPAKDTYQSSGWTQQWLAYARAHIDQPDLNTLFEELQGVVGFTAWRLFDGVYAVVADEQAHEQFTAMLDQIRRLYAERLQIEVSCYRVPASQQPSVGDEAPEGPPLFRQQFVAPRRAPVRISRLRERTYVTELAPQVAESAVGYDARVATAEEGIVLWVLVGAGPDDPEVAAVSLAGEFRQLADQRASGALTADLKLDLPALEVVRVHSTANVPWGRRTVVCTVSGFSDSEMLLVAVRADRVSD